jgi:hypothetical protein
VPPALSRASARVGFAQIEQAVDEVGPEFEMDCERISDFDSGATIAALISAGSLARRRSDDVTARLLEEYDSSTGSPSITSESCPSTSAIMRLTKIRTAAGSQRPRHPGRSASRSSTSLSQHVSRAPIRFTFLWLPDARWEGRDY